MNIYKYPPTNNLSNGFIKVYNMNAEEFYAVLDEIEKIGNLIRSFDSYEKRHDTQTTIEADFYGDVEDG